MHYLSTRDLDRARPVAIGEAITLGLAADGGLYVPERIPRIDPAVLASGGPRSLPAVAAAILRPYFADAALDLPAICAAAFDFPAPLVPLSRERDQLLLLSEGPTAAFKDFGARFLAELLARSSSPSAPRTILVATSGDTGAAVAAAFAGRAGFRVVVLYPDGRVSPRQAHQLGAFGENVAAFRVDGSFDDCQALVKAAFADEPLRTTHGLRSANSISLGRLLPQMAYYARASLELADRGLGPASFVVPTGNLGNAVACLYARAMGLPIARVALATNANRVLADFVHSGAYTAASSVATLANAMDVGAPSNVERLRALIPDPRAPEAALFADTVDDASIREAIRAVYAATGRAICPHTACGTEVLRRLRARGEQGTWVVAATAHPAKFETIVEPIIGTQVTSPPALARLLARPSHAEPLEPTLAALKTALAR